VIAAYGDRVVMEDTLGEALAALFKNTSQAASPVGGTANARAREALAHYDRAIERLKAGDWSGFGAELIPCGHCSKHLAAAVPAAIRSDLNAKRRLCLQSGYSPGKPCNDGAQQIFAPLNVFLLFHANRREPSTTPRMPRP
jgi:hypothetical protein